MGLRTSGHLLGFMLLVGTLWCSNAHAEVVAKAAGGFQINIETEIEGDPSDGYRALVEQVSNWWLDDHTYSGDSSNLYIDASEQGWFGERLADGGICCHLHVVFVEPGKTIRFTGGLGPLQSMGVHGAMSWELAQADEKTIVVWTYNVSGYSPTGLDAIAPIVDAVLQQQVNAFTEYASESR